ncbi:MAG: Maf family protein [Kiritimatiellae bacterium]|jgi:septum formation protein|nr:Maf family protein [Kiritimatiellia bacterium]
MNKPPLILGSASPRRKKILQTITQEFTIATADVEEIHDASDPVRTVTHNALVKYNACRKLHPDAALIAADTLVWFEGRLIGKPVDLQEAAEFLRTFSGRSQIVFSGIALGMPEDATPDIRVEASSVHFNELSEATIQGYLQKTMPLDRAGAYDIDENGDLLVAEYSGSYTNIMGMPREVIRDWLKANGMIEQKVEVVEG